MSLLYGMTMALMSIRCPSMTSCCTFFISHNIKPTDILGSMKQITLVTGNPNKLAELQEIFPADVSLRIEELKIPELQEEEHEPHGIILDKVRQAYELVGGPVIVEDVSAELAAYGGFPGPYIKSAERRIGKHALWKLVQGQDDKRATIRCTMAYFDGADPIIVEGAVSGTIVEPRGDHGWGFDFCFMQDGETRTNAELQPGEKNGMSHRYLAVKALTEALFPESH